MILFAHVDNRVHRFWLCKLSPICVNFILNFSRLYYNLYKIDLKKEEISFQRSAYFNIHLIENQFSYLI